MRAPRPAALIHPSAHLHHAIGLPAALLFCVMLSGPAPAQTAEEAPPPAGEQIDDLLERGAKGFLRDLLKEVQPHLDGLSKMVSDLEPMVREMARMVDDVRNYDRPRLLPNGDILIPRRPGAPTSPLLEEQPDHSSPDLPEPGLPEPGPGGEIEL